MSGGMKGLIDTTSLSIRWAIPEYYSLLHNDVQPITSPRFQFLDGEWYLRMITWGRHLARNRGKIAMCLHKHCLRTGIQQFHADVLITNRSEVIGRWSRDLDITIDEEDLGMEKFVEGAEFVCEREFHYPLCLRVLCRLTERDNGIGLTVNAPKEKSEDEVKENTARRTGNKDDIKTKDSPTGLDVVCQNLRDLLLNERLCDVTFRIEDEEFRAHRAILAARSPVFQAMMEHDTKEKESGIIEISDCSAVVFKEFLQYLYSGMTENLSQENMCGVYRLADKYDLGHLRNECTALMTRSLNADNFCDVISLASTYNESELTSIATEFFVRHTKDILPTVKWQTFMAENVTMANELYMKRIEKLG